MGFYILQMLIGMSGIRGHIPQFDNDPPRIGPSLASSGGTFGRVVAAFVATALFLIFVLWIAVWLALRLL